jgi:acetylornithine deacetylase/succinyl-diaminopimelate desuccinylase-like protein
MAPAGIKTIIYGPGGEYINVPDERIRVKDVVTATKVMALAAAESCT